jgi:5-methylcytosine-specific restriction enzyme subunit McrC
LLGFPELSPIKVTENTFSRLTYNRKTEPYREALNIARLILLNYHPDLSKGQNNVLALLFNMNVLWERFVLKSLKEFAPADYKIKGKIRKPFWQPEKGNHAFIEPDIVIEHNEITYVLDTKWKVLKDNRPSDDDLKQMYVYSKYYNSSYTALVYPSNGIDSCSGRFCPEFEDAPKFSCSLLRINLPEESGNIKIWQYKISNILLNHVSSKE